ncbi:MAG TPA: hypothetical protein VGV36_03775 [Solirubrobacteraceae bacterium]|nr:hypothetical protein [Solirubrobacteraceae bacterium]
MSAGTVRRKLRRVTARIASGDEHLEPFRRSLWAQLAVIERRGGGR